MPDLGNWAALGGLEWYREYELALEHAGLPKPVRALSSELGAFGDGTPEPPLFIAVNVPIFFQTEADPLGVLYNIRIVRNSVGLLLGKSDLEAVGFSCQFSQRIKRFTISVGNSGTSTEVKVQDTGSHYYILLAPPMPSDTVLPHVCRPTESSLIDVMEQKVDVGQVTNVVRGTTSRTIRPSDILRLHRQFGHPSAERLISVLADAMPDEELGIDVRNTITTLDCEICNEIKRPPAAPITAIPTARCPGKSASLDLGSFFHPVHRQNYVALIGADEFSLFVFGGILQDMKASTTVSTYLHTTPNRYELVRTDLGPQFDSETFREVMRVLGATARIVPADAHWPSRAEKPVDLLRLEWAAVVREHPEMIPDNAFRLSVLRLNDKPTNSGYSRGLIHSGGLPNRNLLPGNMEPSLQTLEPPDLPNAQELTVFLAEVNNIRTTHRSVSSKLRINLALRGQLRAPLPQYCNGDLFLYYRSDARKKGFYGPAVAIGQHRSLVVGIHHGSVITAHASRTRHYIGSLAHMTDSAAHLPEIERAMPPVPSAVRSLLDPP
jgi:hypothetical protein